MLVTVKRQSPDDTEAVPVKHRVWTVCTTSPPLPSAVSATGYILLQHQAFSCTTAASGPSERDGKRKWASLWRLILNSSPLSNTYSRFQWGSRRCVVAPSIHRKTSFKQLCFCAIDTEDVIDQVTRHDWPFPQSRLFWLCAPITVRFRSSSGQTDPQFYITTAVTSV